MSWLPFKFGKKEKPKYFLALILREDKVNAVLFEETFGKVNVIATCEEYFEDSIETASEDELLTVVDRAVSTAEQILPIQIETHQTVFGLKENWTDGTSIKKEYLAKLKKISEALGLAPIGFMVIPEAIAHFLQKEEGAPVSAVLVEVGLRKLIVSLIRAGRIVETKTAQLENNSAQTVDAILKHFDSADILPSRIILFDDSHKEDLLQEFIAHQWSKSLPFLHVPQTTSLPKDFAVHAVIVASANQLGFEILGKPEGIIRKAEKVEKVEDEIPAESKKTASKMEEKSEPEEELRYDEVSAEKMGFSSEEKAGVIEMSKEYREHANILSIKAQGGEDLEMEVEKTDEIKSQPLGKGLNTVATVFESLKDMISSIVNMLLKGPKKIIIIPILLICFLLVFLAYIFSVHATVTLELKPKTITKTQDVIFSVVSPSDFSKNIIHAELVKTTKDGSKTIDTTGKKEIGDKAKGSVTLYSRFDSEKTFPQGTIISYNNLDFTFDAPVTIASTSADASAQPSTAKVNVTATQIGKESNLPSGTKFSIGNVSLSTVVAKNDSAFSGGSKKEVTVVGKEDVDKIIAALTKDLEPKAQDDLEKVVSSESDILPAFIDESLIKKDLSKQIGEEAKSVTLKATIQYTGITYKKDDLITYGKDVLKNDFPSNLSIAPNGIRADVEKVKQKNDKQTVIATKLQALLLPNIDTKSIAAELSGKSFLAGEDFLLKLPQVDSVHIQLSPNIPFIPKILPRISGNITVTTQVND